MAAEIDGHRKAGDVRGINLYVNGERGYSPSKSLRPDAQVVDPLEELAFEDA